MGGKSGGSSKIEVFDHFMSMHLGICASRPGTKMLAVKMGEKEVWRGESEAMDLHYIEKYDLYGGAKKEGGVAGSLWWLPGQDDQMLPPPLASRFGLSSEDAPGFRGLASIFLTGRTHPEYGETYVPPSPTPAWGEGVSVWEALMAIVNANAQVVTNQRGFYLCSNNPYLKAISVRVRCTPIGLDPSIALIRLHDDSQGNAQYAANPAHMVYECMTNLDWGMGDSPLQFNKSSFEACAQTFFDEKFGLNMIWSQQSSIESFIAEILDHVQAVVFVDPATGLHTMKALRGDYDIDDLKEINPSNAVLSDYRRKTWGEITNEVTVTITNPETGQAESYTAQDLGGIAAQGGIIPSAKDYYGICSPELGARVAERDLAASVHPIATVEATVSREFWDTVTGDVVRLSWPEYGISSIAFRVSEVTKGRHEVVLGLYEDIFGLELATYLTPGASGWENPDEPPAPLEHVYIGTAPAFMVTSALGLVDPSHLVYPEALSALTAGPDSLGDLGYDLTTWFADVNGTPYRDAMGTRSLSGTFTLSSVMPAESETTLILDPLRGISPTVGSFILIGGGSDEKNEIATVQDAWTNSIRINRGTLDTVPREWPIGTRCWVIPSDAVLQDTTIRSVGEDVSYWLQTRTNMGILPIDATPEQTVTLSNRPYLPLRPANVKVQGEGFGPVNLIGVSTVGVTWAVRNRVLEVTQVMKWTDTTVTGESGQTVTVQLLKTDGTLITQYTGYTGTSMSFPITGFASETEGIISVLSERDGMKSLQSHEIFVTL